MNFGDSFLPALTALSGNFHLVFWCACVVAKCGPEGTHCPNGTTTKAVMRTWQILQPDSVITVQDAVKKLHSCVVKIKLKFEEGCGPTHENWVWCNNVTILQIHILIYLSRAMPFLHYQVLIFDTIANTDFNFDQWNWKPCLGLPLPQWPGVDRSSVIIHCFLTCKTNPILIRLSCPLCLMGISVFEHTNKPNWDGEHAIKLDSLAQGIAAPHVLV